MMRKARLYTWLLNCGMCVSNMQIFILLMQVNGLATRLLIRLLIVWMNVW